MLTNSSLPSLPLNQSLSARVQTQLKAEQRACGHRLVTDQSLERLNLSVLLNALGPVQHTLIWVLYVPHLSALEYLIAH